MLKYEIDIDPFAHEFVICLKIDVHGEKGLEVTLPAWIPGSYMVRDFARNITEISAQEGDRPVSLEKVDKQTWRLGPCDGTVTINYHVYAFDLSVRSAYVDDKRAYFNGTSLFLRPVGYENATWQVELRAPEQPDTAEWRVYTTMPAGDLDARGFGLYQGSGYASLVDYPVEIGHARVADFVVDGRPHQIAISDGGNFDLRKISRDLAPICAEHAAMFGELPVARYLFQVLATGDGYGGLEHLDSTSLVCKRSDLPSPTLARTDKAYRQFLGLCSHEYFHLWNVKRIRPQRLAEADLSREVNTELLWAFEGITSYYDDLALLRSGTIDAAEYLELLAAVATRVLRGEGRRRQSVAASSFDAWTKFYKQDENAPNAIVSYYAKGSLIAFGLDMLMRTASADRLSLDDLMRALWQAYGKTGTGIPERGIERVLADLLQQPVDDFFNAYVYGTEELPLADWFAAIGVGFRLRPAMGPEDQGSSKAEPPSDTPPPGIGVRLESRPEGLVLTHVLSGGAAQLAGMCPGDVLLAIDGQRVGAASLPGLLERAENGAVDAHYFRRDRLFKTRIEHQTPPADTCDLWLLDDDLVSSDCLKRRAAWSRSNRET